MLTVASQPCPLHGSARRPSHGARTAHTSTILLVVQAVTSKQVPDIFILIRDREPNGPFSKSNDEAAHAALVRRLLFEEAILQPVSRTSCTWQHQPKYGQVYYCRLKATIGEVTAAATRITASNSGVSPNDTLYKWAGHFLALPKDQQRVPDYVGFTTDTLHRRFAAAAWAHERDQNKYLVGKLCKLLNTELEAFLVFTPEEIGAAVESSGLPSRHVVGFAEQLAASIYGTQMRFGGMNVGPTGGSPPHPNTGPQMLAFAVYDRLRRDPDGAKQLGFDPDDLSPDAVKDMPVLTAVEMCGDDETCWDAVAARLDHFVEDGRRNEMTIRALMSAIGAVGGGYR